MLAVKDTAGVRDPEILLLVFREDDLVVFQDDLDALIHHGLQLLAQDFASEASLLGKLALLPLGELVQFVDHALQLRILDLDFVLGLVG